MQTNIYLIRHGKTQWNHEQRLQGHVNICLSDEGIEQAHAVADFLSTCNQHFSGIYSSDLNRASETAEVISRKLGVPLSCSSKLRERDMGEWAGKTIHEIQDKYPDWMMIRDQGELFGIEGTQELGSRMEEMLRSIVLEQTGSWVCAISHGGAINAVLSRITEGKINRGKTALGNTSITHLMHDEEKWHVVEVGMTPHLSSLQS